MEVVVPEVLSEPVLQLDEVVNRDLLLALEELLNEAEVRCSEVLLACLDRTRIVAGLVLLTGTSLSALADLTQQLTALLLGDLALGVLFHSAPQSLGRDLQQGEEEEELSERDGSIAISINLLQDSRRVLLKIFVSVLEERGVAIGRNGTKEIFVAHTHLTTFKLLSGEHFEAFFGWREETDFILI